MARVTLPPVVPGAEPSPLERRAAALEKTKAAFGLKRFSFRRDRDCGRMIMHHLGLLGRRLRLSKLGKYRDAAGAQAALQRLGFANLIEVCDDRLERIPFARALVGDVMAFEAEPGPFADLGCLVIYMGDGAVFGYHADAQRPVVMKLTAEPLACWSAL